MALNGRLEELTPPEIFQLIALTRKSGKLVLTSGERQGVVVFKEGRVVFAASDALRSTFSTALADGALVNDSAFLQEVERAAPGSTTDSGSFVVELRHSMSGDLEALVRDQIERIARELVEWRTGTFVFEPLEPPEAEEILLDRAWFLADGGVGPEELLLNALTKLDETERGKWEHDLEVASARGESAAGSSDRSDSEISAAFEVLIDDETGEISWAPVPLVEATTGRDLERLRSLIGEVHELEGMSPRLTADVTLLILRYAAQVVNRGVLFAVRADGLQGIGQFGLRPGKEPADKRVRDLRIPLGSRSVLVEVLESGQSFRGRPAPSLWNDFLAERLGGGRPREVVVVPLLVDSTVIAAFYGDNLPGARVLGAVDGLEILMHEIGLAVEKARLEERLARLEKGPASG